ncbi:lytic murein transglycosylase [Rhodomicrobium sp. Az07]|uniref:lytic murein transglycosylase n=1 Tax=Rhodomicrobium sp. Az07 TaxID=2839034 RepID=UPI001BECEDA0|nr:lytic murein transglycosylase [Rhodomicrobium sp. Az07]MBT3070815.1 lytic murein transglycosylase [Rhodomicrobium sp. Az07]
MIHRRQHKISSLVAFCGGLLCVLLAVSIARPALSAEPTQDGFRTWVASFRQTALDAGVKPEVYDRATRPLTADFSLPDLDIGNRKSQGEQPEFVRTPAQYVSEQQMASLRVKGRNLAARHEKTLADLKSRYDVDPYIMLGLWGRETAFGTHHDGYSGLRVLATQGYIGRRAELFRKQFIDALKMVQIGAITPETFKTSWAGAFGLVQFMPTDYLKYAVEPDGRKLDIWRSVPDALTALARNLHAIGWNAKEPWGFEVRAPEGVDCSLGYLDLTKTVGEWERLGVRPLKGERFPDALRGVEVSLLQPAGIYGPAFLTTQNFQVIREYNKSDLYALYVAHLADRIRGQGPFAKAWEPIRQVHTSDVEYLQKRLSGLGLYADTVDGKAGGRTRAAVGAYQKRAGLPLTCWPTDAIVAHVKANAGKATLNERQ